MSVSTNSGREHQPLHFFFLLVFVLSAPIWLVGSAKLPLPVNLPVSALTAFVPAIAALILSFKEDGSRSVKELFQTAWDYQKIRNQAWYLPILLLAPLIYIISFIVIGLARLPLPDPIHIPLVWLPVFFGLYLITGAGEELGWSGYATEPLQNRLGMLRASFMLGIVWAIWHSITFVQTQAPIDWVIWQCIKTVAMRMIIVWVYNRTGKSVFAATLYHATDNVSWSLFPNYGTYYDPLVTGLINCVVVLIIIFAGGLNGFKLSYRQK